MTIAMHARSIVTHHRCNQNCGHCTSRREADDLAFIRGEAVRARIDAAIAEGARTVTLTGGEPTMRGDLAALVAHARASGAEEVVLETNATLVDAASAAALLRAGLGLARVNLAGWGEGLDAVTRDPGGFERTLGGLRALLDAGVRVTVDVAIVKGTLALLGELPRGLAGLLREEGRARTLDVDIRVPVESPDPSQLVSGGEAEAAVASLMAELGAAGIQVRRLPVAASVPATRVVRPAPASRSSSRPELVCTAPWTTLEVLDPIGWAHQCCADWTIGSRGNLHGSSLAALWNGPGFQEARRILAGPDPSDLCRPICPRLADRKLGESRFTIRDGAPAFVANQRLLAEDIAARREVVRGRPLYLVLCPSTYCNYDCVMCACGRTPRRDLSDDVLDELPAFLPTVHSLTFGGGEPLANPLVMRFLRGWDRRRYPDAGLSLTTNGSLLGESVLAKLEGCRFSQITISLNAGTPEVYERVQRGIALDRVLANVDALVRFRDRAPAPFPITLSFVVMPGNARDLVAFGELAQARGLDVRLLPVSVPDRGRHTDEVDFYLDPDVVARVLEELDRFRDFARRVRPPWLDEIAATRTAILGEVAARARTADARRRLPVFENAPASGGGRLPV